MKNIFFYRNTCCSQQQHTNSFDITGDPTKTTTAGESSWGEITRGGDLGGVNCELQGCQLHL